MRRFRADLTRAAARLVLAGTMAIAAGRPGFAQSPFNPFGRQASSSYSATRVPDSVNRPSAARDINEFDDLDGGLYGDFGGGGSLGRGGVSTSPRSTLRSRLGVPYFRAHREYDEEYGRVYRPNREADAEFYARQTERSERYRSAMKEKDPAKRAELLRKMTRDFSDVDRLRSTTPKAAKPAGPGTGTEPGAEPATEKPAAGDSPTSGTSPSSRALRDAMERSSRGGVNRRSPSSALRRAMPNAAGSGAGSSATPKPESNAPVASPRINLPARRPRLPIESLDEPSPAGTSSPARPRAPGAP